MAVSVDATGVSLGGADTRTQAIIKLKTINAMIFAFMIQLDLLFAYRTFWNARSSSPRCSNPLSPRSEIPR